MIKLLKNIIFIILSLIILLTTAGFNIYQSYCDCINQSRTFVFVNIECCNHLKSCEHSHSKNHTKENNHKKCIDNQVDTCPSSLGRSCNSENCCKTIQKYFKIYSSPEPRIIKYSFDFLAYFIITLNHNNYDIGYTFIKNIFNYNKKIPPLLFGKYLIYYLNKLKIPVLVS